MDRQTTITLLDKAKEITGSDYKTAQQIHVSRMQLSQWRRAKAQIPIPDVTLLSQVAGLDAVEWTARAVASMHEGTAKGAALQSALKKALPAIAGVVGSSGAKAAITTAFLTALAHDYLIRCIERLSPAIDLAYQNGSFLLKY
jgi:hypothetical protein